MKRFGIDVSEHNGIIDWKAIKRAGVEFAIIRSSYGHFVEDQQFRRNVKECERYKIPYGLYHYSYVANHAQMKEEAEGFLRQCRSCKPAYPCFIDMEDADGWKARHGLSDAMNIETVYYTCDTLEKAGYYPGVYANLDWLEHRINSPRLDRFDKWVAQWASKITYDKPYGMWQFSDKGTINGYRGWLDFDYAYKDYPKIIKEKGFNGFSKDDGNSSKPEKPKPYLRYHVGDHVHYSGLWTQSNGGNWYPLSSLRVKEGTITKVIKTAQHPYLIEHNIGWANNQVIEDAQKPSIHFHVGELVRFDGLWTASDGGIWYSKDQLLIKSGRITKVIKGAKHPFLINNGLGWASAAVLHHI